MVESGYNNSLYNDAVYGSNIYKVGTKITCGLLARILPAPKASPPVIDSIVEGLVERFDWLQQAVQSMQLLCKIEYAPGRDPDHPDDTLNLDDAWGKLYDTPRPTGWSDADYRTLLQNRIKVLTGCGTAPNACSVLDHITGEPGATVIESLWPAQAIINFDTVPALRAAQARVDLINDVLPDLFAAGITSVLHIPFIESEIRAAIQGDAISEVGVLAAVQGEPTALSVGLDALIALGKVIDDTALYAAIQDERLTSIRLNSAVSAIRSLSLECRSAIAADLSISDFELRAAISGEPEIQFGLNGAVQGEASVENEVLAAVAKTFAIQSRLMACIKIGYVIDNIELRAAVEADLSLTCGLRARIARVI